MHKISIKSCELIVLIILAISQLFTSKVFTSNIIVKDEKKENKNIKV